MWSNLPHTHARSHIYQKRVVVFLLTHPYYSPPPSSPRAVLHWLQFPVRTNFDPRLPILRMHLDSRGAWDGCQESVRGVGVFVQDTTDHPGTLVCVCVFASSLNACGHRSRATAGCLLMERRGAEHSTPPTAARSMWWRAAREPNSETDIVGQQRIARTPVYCSPHLACSCCTHLCMCKAWYYRLVALAAHYYFHGSLSLRRHAPKSSLPSCVHLRADPSCILLSLLLHSCMHVHGPARMPWLLPPARTLVSNTAICAV